MLTGYVADQIRRANRNLLITNVVLLLICIGVIAVSVPYIAECLRGPFPMTVKEIAGLSSYKDAPHRYVKVAIDQDNLDPLRIEASDNKTTDIYRFLHVGGNFLVIKTANKDIPDEMVGSLSDLSGDISDKVMPKVGGDVEGNALPVSLDLGSYTFGMWIEFVVCGLFGLLALWNIFKAVIRRGDLEKHPAAKQLAHLGPPEEIAVAVDAEVKAGADQAGGNVMLTQSWLINPYAFGVKLVYLGDVAWLYKKETKHKSYGVTTRTSYATVVHDVRGKRYEFSLKKAQVEGLLAAIASKVPWAFVGYDANREDVRKNRKDVIAAVEARKAAVMAEAAKAPPLRGA